MTNREIVIRKYYDSYRIKSKMIPLTHFPYGHNLDFRHFFKLLCPLIVGPHNHIFQSNKTIYIHIMQSNQNIHFIDFQSVYQYFFFLSIRKCHLETTTNLFYSITKCCSLGRALFFFYFTIFISMAFYVMANKTILFCKINNKNKI